MLNMLSKDTSLLKYLGKGNSNNNSINKKRPLTAKERTVKSNTARKDSELQSIAEKEETSTDRTGSNKGVYK